MVTGQQLLTCALIQLITVMTEIMPSDGCRTVALHICMYFKCDGMGRMDWVGNLTVLITLTSFCRFLF